MSERIPQLCAAALALLGFLALAAPWISPHPPNEQPDSIGGRLQPPLTSLHAVRLSHGWILSPQIERTPEGLTVLHNGQPRDLPESQVLNLTPDGVADRHHFLLGSDRFSRDVLARLLYGARISFFVAITSIALAGSLGVLFGGLAALGGRLVDTLLMRLVDGLLAFPWLILIIALASVTRTGPVTLILLIGATGWMGVSRIVRAELLSLKKRDFVTAARGLGLTPLQIFLRHLLPNTMTPVAAYLTLIMSQVILAEAALSFLGFGIQPPTASWGNMISDGSDTLLSAWWISGFPAAALVITVLALNLLGDSLRDYLDPRFQHPGRR